MNIYESYKLSKNSPVWPTPYLQTQQIIHLCDGITDNVDEAGHCVAAAGRLGIGMSVADVELPMPADNRGNGDGCRAPADNCATAAGS